MTANNTTTHLFDPWTRDYCLLGLRMDRVAPGTVDAWIGPPEWRERVNQEAPPSATALRVAADDLLDRLPGMGYERTREEYLRRQVIALRTIARATGGEEIPFVEQAELFFDIHPERVPEERFEAAHRRMDSLLPGSGSLAERIQAWRRALEVPVEKLPAVLDRVAGEVRRRTITHFSLPADESIEIKLVRNQPWSAYNWYLGNARSLIEVNTDLPVRANGLPDYLAHEGYPGHHTEHALREIRQYREAGQGEYAIQLINTPESLISEAIATNAGALIFSGAEDFEWLASEVLPDLGMRLDPEQAQGLRDASEDLNGLSGNAAFLLHVDERPADEVAHYVEHWGLQPLEEARKSLEFLLSPLWRCYTFTYQYGRPFLHQLLTGQDRFAVFERILTRPVYPQLLQRQ